MPLHPIAIVAILSTYLYHGTSETLHVMIFFFFFFFFLNPNLYPARVQQRYRSGHVLLRSAIMSVHLGKEPA